MSHCIRILNAYENNLQNVTLELPHHKLIVVCGVSGSGKSSLISDVLQQEGHRLFVDNFLGGNTHHSGSIARPKADRIEGLFPVIAVNQQNYIRSSRSTVGTLTGIYDYLRLLFARLGKSSIDDLHIHRSLFSFNLPAGYCPQCKGVGLEDHIDTSLLIGDENRSIREGAIVLTTPNNYIIYSQVTMEELDKVCHAEGFNVDIPWKDLSEENRNVIFYGSEKVKILFGKHTLESRLKWTGITAKPREEGYYKGMVPVMEEILKRDRNPNILKYSSSQKCSLCKGSKLSAEAMSVHFHDRSICDLSAMDFVGLHDYLKNLRLTEEEALIAEPVIAVMLRRLQTLIKLGLGHLNCDRESPGINGGEAGRLRLASYANSNLRNVLYILDEPSAGLHPAEHGHLMDVLLSLRDKGNTVIIADHEEQSLRAADHILEIGPGAGIHGGRIVYNGDAATYFTTKPGGSKTLEYLAFRKFESCAASIKANAGHWNPPPIRKNNLRQVQPEFLLSSINVITGLSGSGKSSLTAALYDYCTSKQGSGDSAFRKVIIMDSSPIGRTPRSNPATYTGLGDLIRDLLAACPEAKARSYKKGQFSFAVPGGRCESCGGAGVQQVGMHFLGNVDVVCESCGGKRFLDETLEVRYHGKNIYDILEMSMEEADLFFSDHPKIRNYTSILCDLGLGYMKLGQPSTGLSGGEAQRVKLATELARAGSSSTLYLLDEPANGLHNADIEILCGALRKLADRGHTLICTGNDPCFILQADRVIDLGPGSGSTGGTICFSGSVDELLKEQNNITAIALRAAIQRGTEEVYSKPSSVREENMILKGVRTNNLKNINAEFSSGEITAVCGLSGSGKSSLVYGSLYAESHRLFLESSSSFIKQFTPMPGGSQVEAFSGLRPAISIRKKNAVKNPRSLIAGYSGLYELYRLLFSRLGKDLIHGNPAPLSTAFSFNREEGACTKCGGLGTLTVCDPDLLITHREKPLIAGAMDGSKTGKFYGDPYGQYVATLKCVAEQKGLDVTLPSDELSEEAFRIAMYGCGEEIFEVNWNYKRGNVEGVHHLKRDWPGFTGLVNEEYSRKHADARGEAMLDLMKKESCPSCHGYRLKPEVLQFTIGGLHIGELTAMSAEEAMEWFGTVFSGLFTDPLEIKTADSLKPSIIQRLQALCKAGLGYLSCDRLTASLSGGEFQRLQLAGLVRSPLSGIVYVLDEPSFGLHHKDIEKISMLITDLRSHGNSVVMVEHSRQLVGLAKSALLLGPGAGEAGGEITGSGNAEEILKQVYDFASPLPIAGAHTEGLQIRGACANNLQNIDLDIEAGGLTVFSGVSGSGKSSLLHDVIHQSILAHAARHCTSFMGRHHFSSCLFVEQSIPYGGSQNIGNYLCIDSVLQKIFAEAASVNSQKVKSSNFSRSSADGRCRLCEGSGEIITHLDFLPDVVNVCEECGGSGYRREVLQTRIDGMSIWEAEQSSFGLLQDFIRSHSGPKSKTDLQKIFEYSAATGLSHLSPARRLQSLSGGEMQRLKLIKGLSSLTATNSLIILDEPGAGLDPRDLLRLIELFRGLITEGHTILCASHDELLLKVASHVVELGPGGGKYGGKIISG
jgi:excinuclease ABC subunit A